MKSTNLVGLVAASMAAFLFALPVRAADSAAPTTCKDGTTSTATGKGACSGHGGVQKPPMSTATPAAVPAAPASGATKTCTDGTTSTATGKGACSGHGGVLKTSQSKPAAASTAAPAGSAAPTATAGNTDPTGATAKCKDGTYSKSQHHSGTCSSHGGVAEWLTAQ
jgi:hypothetical protein